MHTLLHGQAVSSSSMEKYGDKDSDSGDVTPKYTGDHISDKDCCCHAERRLVMQCAVCGIASAGAGSPLLLQAQKCSLALLALGAPAVPVCSLSVQLCSQQPTEYHSILSSLLG